MRKDLPAPLSTLDLIQITTLLRDLITIRYKVFLIIQLKIKCTFCVSLCNFRSFLSRVFPESVLVRLGTARGVFE